MGTSVRFSPLRLTERTGVATQLSRLEDRQTDLEAQDSDGRTALDFAVWARQTEMAKALLYAGANINARMYPWQYATYFGETEMMRWLLEVGSDINAQNEDGETALQIAAWKGDLANLRLLLDAGANVQVQCKAGRTALHSAAGWRRTTIMKRLLAAGVEVNAKDKFGRTALHEIMSTERVWPYDSFDREMVECVSILLRAKADVHVKDFVGQTALDMAKARYGATRCSELGLLSLLSDASRDSSVERSRLVSQYLGS